MTLREALRKVDRQKVFDIIHARDSKNAAACDRPAWLQVTSSYTKVIEELLGKPKARRYSMSIVVKYTTDPFDKHRYVDVALLNPRYTPPPKGAKPWGGSRGAKMPKGKYNCNLNKYNKYFSLMGIRWSKIIDTPVVFEAKITLEEALAAFLWELTFDGWTEEKAAAKTDEIMGKIKEAVKEIKEGKCVELPPKKKGGFKVVIPDVVTKQIIDIANKESKPKKCKTCYGFGMWGIGNASPMGPMDASDGIPTYPCPECGANANPRK